MAENFYTILTNVGKAKIANSTALGTRVNLTTMAVGDSAGAYYNPTETQTTLRGERWRGVISSIKVDSSNPSWIVIEAIIPSSDGGFMVREVGIIDDANELIAVGKYPETYKPVVANGSAKDLYIRFILEVSNTENVSLKVDPSVILATQKDIATVNKSLTDHAAIEASPTVLGHVKVNNTLTSTDSKQALSAVQGKVLNDELVSQKNEIVTMNNDLTSLKSVSKVKLNKDDNGIYTTVELKRADTKLYMRSVLSGGISPKYTTRTETYYGVDGTTVLATKIYTRTYDADEVLVSEVLQ